ncbi:hypothetical protein FPY71_05665 [Aureimonas fodinaquatilis]|uniref:Uncharacterized protein n=1 Tax=Aureimonas fodinaquatilis TaxID=2565783 RepID=A0A5B0E560_9HYPH|nr:hypothetical protein [Aureimonas fodinaquatilis]KAA0972569.1 hypothetical protein FPY71_05665 [Aureimonas fodinaquatilis]
MRSNIHSQKLLLLFGKGRFHDRTRAFAATFCVCVQPIGSQYYSLKPPLGFLANFIALAKNRSMRGSRRLPYGCSAQSSPIIKSTSKGVNSFRLWRFRSRTNITALQRILSNGLTGSGKFQHFYRFKLGSCVLFFCFFGFAATILGLRSVYINSNCNIP